MNLSFYKTHTDTLLKLLNKHDLITNIQRERVFYDEPKIFSIGTGMQPTDSYSDGIPIKLSGFGYSFTSPQIALFKSIFEGFERFSNGVYREKNLLFEPYSLLEKNSIKSINPLLYERNNVLLKERPIGWVKGENISKNITTYIPAQSVYHNYKRKKNEPYLSDNISTGAAAGIDKTTTLLRGIYEIIERDVFMTIYLNKISSPKVQLEKLGWIEINNILNELKRYNLEICVLDITNDLGIPTYLSLLLDYTGIGPSITLGLKSSLSPRIAILGSIEESCLVRPWLRYQLRKTQNRELNIIPNKISSILERGLYWSHPKMLDNLDFFLETKENISKIKDTKFTAEKELDIIKDKLRDLSIDVYNVNITPPFLKAYPYQVHKVTIPQLQPLYLLEDHKILRSHRINAVAQYFNQKNVKINSIPHPFL